MSPIYVIVVFVLKFILVIFSMMGLIYLVVESIIRLIVITITCNKVKLESKINYSNIVFSKLSTGILNMPEQNFRGIRRAMAIN